MEAGTKYCSGCGNYRGLLFFTPNQQRLDGLKVWCKACIDSLENMRGQKRKRTYDKYRKARRKAYQIWFRTQKKSLMIDRRWVNRPDTPTIRLQWSRRLSRLIISDGSDMADTLRDMLVRNFMCDPADVSAHGRGGGIGVRVQPYCEVEGKVDEANWQKGLASLTEEGWAVFREGYEDVVAPGY